MPNQELCIFCKIVAGTIPSDIVYSDGDVLAFLDIHPTAKGHTLVIPRSHITDFTSISDELAAQLGSRLSALAPKIAAAVDGSDYNLILNCGANAGQIVNHVHWHIIPRFPSDGFRPWPGSNASPDELRSIAEAIRAKIVAL